MFPSLTEIKLLKLSKENPLHSKVSSLREGGKSN